MKKAEFERRADTGPFGCWRHADKETAIRLAYSQPAGGPRASYLSCSFETFKEFADWVGRENITVYRSKLRRCFDWPVFINKTVRTRDGFIESPMWNVYVCKLDRLQIEIGIAQEGLR